MFSKGGQESSITAFPCKLYVYAVFEWVQMVGDRKDIRAARRAGVSVARATWHTKKSHRRVVLAGLAAVVLAVGSLTVGGFFFTQSVSDLASEVARNQQVNDGADGPQNVSETVTSPDLPPVRIAGLGSDQSTPPASIAPPTGTLPTATTSPEGTVFADVAPLVEAPQGQTSESAVVAMVPDRRSEGMGRAAGVDGSACVAEVKAMAERTVLYFPQNSVSVNATQRPALTVLLEKAIACPSVSIEVMGHTDDDGEELSNLGLSWRRAEAVAAYMSENGIAEERLRVVGLGAKYPIANNISDDGRAVNRRVDFAVR